MTSVLPGAAMDAPAADGSEPGRSPARLRVSNVEKTFVTRDGQRLRALLPIEASVGEAEFVSIVGPSGCGKTTLLKIMAGLIQPTRGQVLYQDRPIRGPQPGIGLVFQTPVLLPWQTVLNNVQLPGRILGLPKRELKDTAFKLLDMVHLAEFAHKYPFELSGGMQQRVAIARALVHDPSLLLMDEPFGALDAMTRDQMNVELQRIWMESRKSTVFITHSISEAVFLADRVIVMSARPGRILEQVTVPYDRPRQLELLDSGEFGEIVSKIRASLGEQI